MFNPKRSKRFRNLDVKSKFIPGPGHYTPSSSITKNGDYFVSKFGSSKCRTFYHCDRSTMNLNRTKLGTPGPGSYRIPSEFGHYKSKFTGRNG